MNPEQVLTACRAAGVVLRPTGRGTLRYQPTPPSPLLEALRANKAAVLSILTANPVPESAASPCRHDPAFPDVEPDPAAEAAALREGWVRHPDGRWDFPASWARVQPPTTASDLRPLTAAELEQFRRPGVPMPAGVSFGEDADRRWRRLS